METINPAFKSTMLIDLIAGFADTKKAGQSRYRAPMSFLSFSFGSVTIASSTLIRSSSSSMR